MASIKKSKGDLRRIIILSLVTLIYIGFVAVNASYQAGIIFAVLAGISFVVLIQWDKLPKKRPERKLFGVESDILADVFFGIAVGLAILFLMKLLPGFVIAVPDAPQSGVLPQSFASVEQFLIVDVTAPLVEEVLFRSVLFGILWVVLGLGFFSSSLLTNLAFSAYHIKAYAGVLALNPILAVSGAFFSAFVVGMVFSGLVWWRGSIASSIAGHSTINTGLTSSSFVVVDFLIASLIG